MFQECPLCGLHVPFCCGSIFLLWAHGQARLAPRLAGCETQPCVAATVTFVTLLDGCQPWQGWLQVLIACNYCSFAIKWARQPVWLVLRLRVSKLLRPLMQLYREQLLSALSGAEMGSDSLRCSNTHCFRHWKQGRSLCGCLTWLAAQVCCGWHAPCLWAHTPHQLRPALHACPAEPGPSTSLQRSYTPCLSRSTSLLWACWWAGQSLGWAACPDCAPLNGSCSGQSKPLH